MKKPARVKTKPTPVELVCWDLENWPEDVFPHNELAGRHLYRENAKSLMASGAVKRRGRRLVFFGQKYVSWLIKHSSSSISYEMAPNKPGKTAKRDAANLRRHEAANGVAHAKEARA